MAGRMEMKMEKNKISKEKSNINEQILAFNQVLPFEGQVEAVALKEDGSCRLRFYAPNAKSVSVLIEETKYPCVKNQEGIWEMAYPSRKGIQYVQLLIDDTEFLTPMLPITYGYSRPYNYVALYKPEESFYQIKDVPHGSVRREFFFSEVTGEWESCVVYTPYIYEKETDRVFPVLYLQHGHGENEIGWTNSGKVHFILDNLIAEGKAVPFVVVMCNGMVQTVEDGRRIVNFRLLEKQLFQDVMPFVEGKFRVGRTKKMRAMAGLSMGSVQTSMIGLSHPDSFSALGIFSGFMRDIITGGELDMSHGQPGLNPHLALLEDKEEFVRQYPICFRAMGTEDPFWEHFAADDEMLKQKQIPHIRKEYPGAHDWNVWRMCIYDFAQLIFKD